jgi:hypothetical protein
MVTIEIHLQLCEVTSKQYLRYKQYMRTYRCDVGQQGRLHTHCTAHTAAKKPCELQPTSSPGCRPRSATTLMVSVSKCTLGAQLWFVNRSTSGDRSMCAVLLTWVCVCVCVCARVRALVHALALLFCKFLEE